MRNNGIISNEGRISEFSEFMHRLIDCIPRGQLPTDLILDDGEYALCLGGANGWEGPSGFIRCHKRSKWNAEQEYKDRLNLLERRIKELEKCLSLARLT